MAIEIYRVLETLSTVHTLQVCIKMSRPVTLHVVNTEELLMADVTFKVTYILMGMAYMSV